MISSLWDKLTGHYLPLILRNQDLTSVPVFLLASGQSGTGTNVRLWHSLDFQLFRGSRSHPHQDPISMTWNSTPQGSTKSCASVITKTTRVKEANSCRSTKEKTEWRYNCTIPSAHIPWATTPSRGSKLSVREAGMCYPPEHPERENGPGRHLASL